MIKGDIAVVVDSHIGVDDNFQNYVLTPGDTGLIISKDSKTTTLLISGVIVYVQTYSLKKVSAAPAMN